MKPRTIVASAVCALALGAALLWISMTRPHGVPASEAPARGSTIPTASTSAAPKTYHTANLSPGVSRKTPAAGTPQAQPTAIAPLSVHDGAARSVAPKVTKRQFVKDVQAMTRIGDIAMKYGAPEKIVGTDSAVWRCADGDVTVKAYNQPAQVMQNDGSWKAVDDYHIQAVSVLPQPQSRKDAH